ncbi:MAG: signal peptidase II [Vulcanimicrobiota bacterium]
MNARWIINSTAQRTLLLGGLFTVLLLADQVTKLWAIETMAGAPPRHYLGGIFTLTYAENTGGWGSLGANWSPLARRITLIIAPAIVLVGLGVYLVRTEKFDWIRSLGYVGIISGGVGNLIDRFRLEHVVDFLYMGYGPIGTNIFNIADMGILFGFILVLYRSWVLSKQETGDSPVVESDS